MHLVHGVILWAIVALTVYAINNNHPLIGVSSHPALNEEQIKDIMERVKANAPNPVNMPKNIKNEEKKVENNDKSDSLDEIRK